MASKKILLSVLGIVSFAIFVITGFVFLNNNREESNAMKAVLGPIELPKAPHWDALKSSIYFVDIFTSEVHRFDPISKVHKTAKVGSEPLAFIIPIKNSVDSFIISYGSNIAKLTWDGNSEKTNLQILKSIGEGVYRANEGKVSPSGALFIGTHSPLTGDGNVKQNSAGLFAYYKDGTIKQLLQNVTISNGMGWSKDGKKFYYIDSLAYTVESFSYDIKTDALDNRTLIINFKEKNLTGLPDGMAIDNEDKLWVTSFNGHMVIQIDPESRQILKTIDVEALKVTSAVFAGPSLNTFYITSGNYQNTEEDTKKYPCSGYIFEIIDFASTGRGGVSFEM